jgi:hypothetical protein
MRPRMKPSWHGASWPRRGVSVGTYLDIEIYQNEHAQEVAGLILISTVLALIVLPLVLTFGI